MSLRAERDRLVDRGLGRAAAMQHVADVVDAELFHAPARLERVRSNVRHDGGSVAGQQVRMHARLVLENVKSHTGDPGRLQCFDQRLFIDNRAAGRVDEHGVWAHRSEGPGVDHVSRLRAEWHVQRHNIRGDQQ